MPGLKDAAGPRSIGYARELGLAQHPDFGRTAGYLVAWDGECELHDLRLIARGRVVLPFARDLALDLQPPDPGPCVYLSYWTWAVSVIRL